MWSRLLERESWMGLRMLGGCRAASAVHILPLMTFGSTGHAQAICPCARVRNTLNTCDAVPMSIKVNLRWKCAVADSCVAMQLLCSLQRRDFFGKRQPRRHHHRHEARTKAPAFTQLSRRQYNSISIVATSARAVNSRSSNSRLRVYIYPGQQTITTVPDHGESARHRRRQRALL
jgi:hypothetical protein